MTVFENLLVGAAFGGQEKESRTYAYCKEILDLTGLINKANTLAEPKAELKLVLLM